jgi:hypothetical protein
MHFYPVVGAISGEVAHIVGAGYMFAKAKGLEGVRPA